MKCYGRDFQTVYQIDLNMFYKTFLNITYAYMSPYPILFQYFFKNFD